MIISSTLSRPPHSTLYSKHQPVCSAPWRSQLSGMILYDALDETCIGLDWPCSMVVCREESHWASDSEQVDCRFLNRDRLALSGRMVADGEVVPQLSGVSG